MLTTCYMQSNNCLFMKRTTSKNTIDYHRFFALLKMTEFCRVMEGLAAAKPPPSPHPARELSFRMQRSGVRNLPQAEAAKVSYRGFRGDNSEMRNLISASASSHLIVTFRWLGVSPSCFRTYKVPYRGFRGENSQAKNLFHFRNLGSYSNFNPSGLLHIGRFICRVFKTLSDSKVADRVVWTDVYC